MCPRKVKQDLSGGISFLNAVGKNAKDFIRLYYLPKIQFYHLRHIYDRDLAVAVHIANDNVLTGDSISFVEIKIMVCNKKV